MRRRRSRRAARGDGSRPGRRPRRARSRGARGDAPGAARAVRQPRAALSRLRRHAAADRGRADDLAALHRRPDARGGGDPARRPGARGRRRLGLRERRRAACSPRMSSRSSATPAWPRARASGWRASATPRSTVHCADGSGGWPRGRAVRRDPGGRERAARARGAARPARRRRPAGHAGRRRRAGTSGWCASARRGDDAFDEDDLGGVVFVPLIGAHGWPSGRER